MESIRINKYLASLGVASRRKIDDLIDQKRISLNGKIAKKGDKIDPLTDKLLIDNQPVNTQKEELVYIALNKPLNVLSSVSDNRGRRTVVDFVKIKQRIFPIGRLDYNTTGLILLTNDGDLSYKLTHPKFHLPKTYLAQIAQLPSKPQIDLLISGVPLEDGITAPSDVEIFHKNSGSITLKITLYQGKNRQIRRMMTTIGLDLISLKRISIGPIQLDNLGQGEWRRLTPSEIQQLKK